MVSLYPFIHPALFPCISWIVPPAICLHSASSLNQRGELKAGCIFEPVWLLSCSGSCVSCLWFNGSSLCDIISLHLPPSSAHACIRFITLAIPSLILHLGPSPSCPPRSRSSSPPQSLLSTFTNAPWFRSMWWKWQTVSSTEGKKEGRSLWLVWTQLDLAQRPVHQMGLADCTGLASTTSSFAPIAWIFLLSH